MRDFAMVNTISEEAYMKASEPELRELIEKMVWDRYTLRMRTIAQRALPVFRNVLDEHGDRYENILVPISDGRRNLQIPINLRKAIETDGRELVKGIARSIILLEIDDHWQQHLLAMDELKQSVQNASYEQKDPLIIYKFEGYGLFEKMMSALNMDIVQLLLKAHLPTAQEDGGSVQEAPAKRVQPRRQQRLQTGRSEVQANRTSERSNTPIRNETKIGRNDPCPCGSGKKYKHCCGKHEE